MPRARSICGRGFDGNEIIEGVVDCSCGDPSAGMESADV